MSLATASPSLPESPVLTLCDYVMHRRVLHQLLHSQPVWLIDDILGLRYRARLRLSLSPQPQVHIMDDTADVSDGGDSDVRTPPRRDEAPGSALPEVAALCAPHDEDRYILLIPLTPICTVMHAVRGEECGFRFLMRPPPPFDSADGVGSRNAAGAAPKDDFGFHVIPAALPNGLPVVSAWVTVLQSLCDGSASSSPAATPSGIVGLRQRAGEGRVPVASPSLHSDPTVGTSNIFLESSITPETSHGVLSAPRLCRGVSPSSLGGVMSVHSRGEDWPMQSTVAGSGTSVGSRSTSTPLATTEVSDRDVEEDRRHLERLTEALRVCTREATELKTQLRSVTTASPLQRSAQSEQAAVRSIGVTPATDRSNRSTREGSSPPRSCEVAADEDAEAAALPLATAAAVSDDPLNAAIDCERPPTMAHVSNGLMPGLHVFSTVLPALATSSSEEDGDVDGEASARSAAVLERSDDHVRGGPRSGVTATSFNQSSDSTRPQAPRSSHVCNLGSLGPSCGDLEALRIYNEIHGTHESSSTAGSSCHSIPTPRT